MKNTSKTSPKVLISGGGTGGHIYPAIAIADEICQMHKFCSLEQKEEWKWKKCQKLDMT